MNTSATVFLAGIMWFGSSFAEEQSPARIVVRVWVNDRALPATNTYRFPTATNHVRFGIQGELNGVESDSGRIRFKLEGYDTDWREESASMEMKVRFSDKSGKTLSQKPFEVSGKSPGWTRDIEHSKFIHRRAALAVPDGADGLSVSVSSAGPPTAVGFFAVANLVLTKSSKEGSVERIPLEDSAAIQPPSAGGGFPNWIREGLSPGMAKVVMIEKQPPTFALGIEDDETSAHAEWRLTEAQRVDPSDHITLDWDEAYSTGYGRQTNADYHQVPPGSYRFRVNKLDILGNPLPYETSFECVVPAPFWRSWWFWQSVVLGCIAVAIITWRRIVEKRTERRTQMLKQAHMLESERLNIARNMHDSLGAKLTQISLLSEMNADGVVSLPEAQAAFVTLSEIVRETNAALYETIWTVDPKNDSLQSLLDFLCQSTQKLCVAACIRCELNRAEFGSNPQVSSDIRHHVSLAVKEAVHNAVKHSQTEKLALSIAFAGGMLIIEVRDWGKGFMQGRVEGRGLENMRHRSEVIGAVLAMESDLDAGTVVRFEIPDSFRADRKG